MRVTLLGPVSATAGNSRLSLGGRKQRAVFALLALNANRTVSLDRLVHEIWRDEPPARATLALQAYISRLRRVLAESPDSHPAQIVTRPPGWMLQMPALQIDAIRFTTLAAEGRAQVAAGRPAEGAEQLKTALGLWSGDPLADLDDGSFAVDDARRLREERLDAAEGLIEANLALGADGEVIAEARRYIAEHPYREVAWQALTLALYRSGRQADALATARQLRETLANDLGLDPSPDSQRLEEAILRHEPSLVDNPVLAHQPVKPAAPVAPESVMSPDDEILGRDTELAAVVAAVNEANHGRGQLLVIEGPAGMGKSTVLRRIESSMQAIDGVVLRGSGVGAGAMPALWPWVTVMRQLTEAMPALAGEVLDATESLGLLDPSLGSAANHPQMDPSLARTRLYRAVVDLLAAARADRPVAVIIDDAHWLDAETLDLLALAVDELLARGVVFAIALRPDEAAAVTRAVGSLGAGSPANVVRLALPGLGNLDVARVIQRITGSAPAAEVVDAVVSRTGGNPFFVVELVQLLISERRLDSDSVYTSLPEGIREVIRRRLDRLPEPTLALLGVLALAAHGLDVATLAAVTEMDDDAVLDGCETAVLSGLCVDDAGTGGFTLSHDLVRQTLEEALSSARRIRLHARIGAALREAPDPSPERIVEIAHHLGLGAQVAGLKAAHPYLLMAADDALTRLAPQQANEFLATALRLVEDLPDGPDRSQHEAEIRIRLATMWLIAPSKSEEAQPTVPPLRPEAPVVPPLEPDQLPSWWNAAAFSIGSGYNETAAVAAEAAWRDDLPIGAALTVSFIHGLACFELGRLDQAEASLIRAEQLSVEMPGEPARGIFPFAGTATVMHACVAALRGDDETVNRLVDEAVATPDMSLVQQVTVDFWSTWCAMQQGDATAANRWGARCLASAAGLGDTFYAAAAQLIMGWADAMQGDPAGLSAAHDAHQRYCGYGMRHQLTVQLVALAEAYAHHGEIQRARELVDAANEIAAATGERTLGPRLSRFVEQLAPASVAEAG